MCVIIKQFNIKRLVCKLQRVLKLILIVGNNTHISRQKFLFVGKHISHANSVSQRQRMNIFGGNAYGNRRVMSSNRNNDILS